MAGPELIYEFSPANDHARFVWAAVSGTVAVLGAYIVIGAPRRVAGKWQFFRHREPNAKRRRHVFLLGSMTLLFGAWFCFILAAKQFNNQRLGLKYLRGEYQQVEGFVSDYERAMPTVHSSRMHASRVYWYYTSITVDDNSFRMGLGTRNPRLRHYNFSNPPIRSGDFVRIRHIEGVIVRLERERPQ